MIVYPTENYDSFISVEDAGNYFETRLHSDDWLSALAPVHESALMTAFRSLCELDITIDPEDSAQIQAHKNAQCEQALHELKEDLDSQNVSYFMLSGMQAQKKELPRHSPRAMAILRPYIKAPVVQLVR